jgi:hypothetical protein
MLGAIVLLKMKVLNTRLHVRGFMREKLHNSLISPDITQIVNNFKYK